MTCRGLRQRAAARAGHAARRGQRRGQQDRQDAQAAIDGRTTRHAGYAVSQRIRKRIEEAFGWIKTQAGLAKTKFRGTAQGRGRLHLRRRRLQPDPHPQTARSNRDMSDRTPSAPPSQEVPHPTAIRPETRPDPPKPPNLLLLQQPASGLGGTKKS